MVTSHLVTLLSGYLIFAISGNENMVMIAQVAHSEAIPHSTHSSHHDNAILDQWWLSVEGVHHNMRLTHHHDSR